MVLHFSKAKTILGVAITLYNERKDLALLFEVAGELCFEILGIGLSEDGGTFPSRLVMKSLVCWALGEGERFRLEERDSLRELMIYSI